MEKEKNVEGGMELLSMLLLCRMLPGLTGFTEVLIVLAHQQI